MCVKILVRGILVKRVYTMRKRSYDYRLAYINGYWYYFNASGAMSTGWIQLGGYWYYLEEVGSWQPQGSMYAWDYTPDGYFVNENGICMEW